MSKKDDNERSREESGFKISDRRKFDAEGEPVTSSENDETFSRGTEKDTRTEAQAPRVETPHSSPSGEAEEKQEIDFSGFLLSLATSAMAHLGELPDPSTGQRSEDLRAAQQMIDIISMLQEKTKGNLEEDERRLIEDLLYELRMKYLKKTKAVQL